MSQELADRLAVAAGWVKAPPGCIIDDQGVCRRVLGLLPITADGCVIGPEAKVWLASHYGFKQRNFPREEMTVVKVGKESLTLRGVYPPTFLNSDCYSTQKAANERNDQ